MVNDYISREAAIRAHCDGCVDDGYCGKLDGRYACEDVPNIMAIPAADVVEVVRGEWIVDSIATNIFYCSVCGNDAPVEPTGGTEYKSNFCHNCGADMRKVVEIDQVKDGAE